MSKSNSVHHLHTDVHNQEHWCVWLYFFREHLQLFFPFVTKHLCSHDKAKLHQHQICCILIVLRSLAHYTKNPNILYRFSYTQVL